MATHDKRGMAGQNCKVCGARSMAQARPGNGANLTPRELDVLRCAAQGYRVKGTAAQLGLAPGTVKVTRERAFARLGVHDIGHAIAKALPYLGLRGRTGRAPARY